MSKRLVLKKAVKQVVRRELEARGLEASLPRKGQTIKLQRSAVGQMYGKAFTAPGGESYTFMELKRTADGFNIFVVKDAQGQIWQFGSQHFGYPTREARGLEVTLLSDDQIKSLVGKSLVTRDGRPVEIKQGGHGKNIWYTVYISGATNKPGLTSTEVAQQIAYMGIRPA